MTEEEAVFDPSLKKKKKKKKTPFDLDAAMAGESGATEEGGEAPPAESDDKPADEDKADDFSLDDDFSSMAKKKKKKKKPFDMSELEDAIPQKEKSDLGDKDDGGSMDFLDDDLGMDLSLPSRKKKKKKVILDEEPLIEETEREEGSVRPGGHAWADSDRDYTYDELLKRVFDIMREKNPDMVAGERKKFNMKPPRVMRVGTKKSSFSNFKEICKMLHRQPEHLLAFLLAELGTSGSIDGNDQLIIKGRFQQKQIENVLRSYIKEYVTCHTCKSRETMLQKDTRLYFLQCETCGSRCSVTSIKSGFQAVTGKRAAIRAKKA